MVRKAPKIQPIIGIQYYFLIDDLAFHLNALKREICCPDLPDTWMINTQLRY